MFAIRDQENLVHTHQTTAASKPLNQSIRALQPKTPGNNLKTPFRAHNDENRQILGGKAEKNAFVTPAPRTRAPLGAKTTNAKAQAFRTPAPGQKQAKIENTINKRSTGRKSVKSKIVVAPSEPTTASVLKNEEEEDDEPDFGYAPPPEVPLPDPPLEITYDDTFSYLNGGHMFDLFRCVDYQSPRDESGMSIRLKKEQEVHRRALEQQEQMLLKQIQREEQQKMLDPDEEVAAMIAAGPKSKKTSSALHESRVNTVRARSAATALSGSSRTTASRPPLAATKNTASSLQKKKTTFTVSKDETSSRQLMRSAPPPVSKNTIGFPKAKKAPSILPSPQRVRSKASNPVSQWQINPKEFVRLYGQPPVESEMWCRLQKLGLDDGGSTQHNSDAGDPLFDIDLDIGPVKFDDCEDTDDFQLPLPED